MSHVEAAVAPGAVVWRGDGPAGPILPDGCLDLLLVDGRLVVAGPDTRVREHAGSATVTGVRLSHGLGPRLLGVPASELTDTLVDLADLWPARAVAGLTARVVADPTVALAAWARSAAPDPDLARLFAAASRGAGVDALAAGSGVTTRTLLRRSRAAFGYGPQHLVRVLRLQRALALARAGTRWAEVAALAGYADQPHLARDARDLAGRTPGELVHR